jgi:hypothetical protein
MRTLVALILLAAAAAAQSPVGALDATQFSGADICAKINAAYAALPASGGTIFVPPAVGALAYQCTTPVSISTPGKYAWIEGEGHATAIQWTLASGTMFSFGAGGATCCDFAYGQWGLKDVALFGPGGDAQGDCSLDPSDASVAVALGGAVGAQGLAVTGVDIGCFGVDLSFQENAWGVDVEDSMIGESEHIVEFEPGLTNAGESMRFSDSLFVNNIQNGSSVCQLDLNGQYFNTTFVGDSFDGVQVCAVQGLNVFLMPHFEDVAGNVAVPFLDNSSGPGTTLIAPQFSNTSGQALTPSAYVENSGTLSVWGWNSASPVNLSSCIDQVGPGATLDAYAPDAIVPGCDTWVSGGGTYVAEAWPGQFEVSPPPLAPRPPHRLIPTRRRNRSARPRAPRGDAANGAAAVHTVQFPLRAGGAGFTWIPRLGVEVTSVMIRRTAGSCAGARARLAGGTAAAELEVPANGSASWVVSIPVPARVPVALKLLSSVRPCSVNVVVAYRRWLP